MGSNTRVLTTKINSVPQMRIRDAAAYLGVSDDTVRRWISRGLLTESSDESGRKVVDGYEVAQVARQQATLPGPPKGMASSARNRFVGLVTDIQVDAVMAQVELQCGPFRVVSLMSSEAVRDLGLELGSVAVAVIKSTTVIVETTKGES
ncbi:molybdopterin-binding protein [Promicromonospora sp. AC04]|nr:molybdopterin-binding protein [Promicromonospora sp. AC04]